MTYIDIHTHCPNNQNNVISVLSLTPYDLKLPVNHSSNLFFSIGIHPWYVTSGNINSQINQIAEIADNHVIIAIGEAGLDFNCQTDRDMQLKAFLAMIDLSEKHHKPLIIHCVKAYNEIIALKNKINPLQPWIIHGFRGKPELLAQLLSHKFYISYGSKFNAESVKNTPVECLFPETDDTNTDIKELYNQIARIKQLQVKELKENIYENFKRVFCIIRTA